jgi:hypothetical protein
MCEAIGLDSEEHTDNKAALTTDLGLLVFEWIDHDLRTAPSFEFRNNSDLPKTISKAVLSALALLSKFNSVHTSAFQ